MPLFSKKKSEKKAPVGTYPGQTSYPSQGSYPGQAAYAPPAGAVPQGPPPPYTPIQPQAQAQQYAAPPPGAVGGMAYPQPGAAGYSPYPGQQYPQQMMPQQYMGPPQTVHVPGAFDAGARFGAGASANIPPPPPGVLPNMAQMASAQGHNVVAGQRPDKYFAGGSDGGYTIW